MARNSPKKEQPSNKTAHVMKLVERRDEGVNPVIAAGKSNVPRRLRGAEPLSRVVKRDVIDIPQADGTHAAAEEQITVNITSLVIAEEAPQILRRFNACDCEKCVETLVRLTAESVQARFVKLGKSVAEHGGTQLEALKEPLHKPVSQQMIRLVMNNKKRSFHE
ncbi:MAG: hypothetical protein ACI4KM_05405 [Oscillospiraceae bacterium]